MLTVGIAVDSNVLIYERIREELRGGRNAISAIDAGFKRALATILDSNITTFIAAAVLTPPDIVSQLSLAIPMCLLYELGILAARLVSRPMNLLSAATRPLVAFLSLSTNGVLKLLGIGNGAQVALAARSASVFLASLKQPR